MKEPVRVIYKGLCFNKDFINKVKLPKVLSKRSLIHSNSLQQKFNHTGSSPETDLFQRTKLLQNF